MTINQANAGWNPLPPLPSPNAGFGCGVVAGKIVVLGGSNWESGTKQWMDTIWMLDPKSLKWETHGKLPQPLAYPVVAEWKGDLIIAGGSDGKQPRKEVWRMDASSMLKQIGELKTESVLSAGGILGDDLLILGGCADAAKLDGLHKGGDRLHLPTGDVTALAPAGDVAFGIAANIVVGNDFFVFGGVRHDLIKPFVSLTNAWAFNPGKGGWRSLKPYPLSVHAAAAVKLDEHRIFIGGGYGGDPLGFTAVAFIYDTRRDTYTKALDLPTAGQVGLVRAGEFVYCLGGEDKSPKHRTAFCARVKVTELLKAAALD